MRLMIKTQLESASGYWQGIPSFHTMMKFPNTKAPEVPDFEARLDDLYCIAKKGNHDEIIKTLWLLGKEGAPELDPIDTDGWALKKPSITIK